MKRLLNQWNGRTLESRGAVRPRLGSELAFRPSPEQQRLRAMGHSVRTTRQGDAHTVWVDPQMGTYHGAADHRISGHAAGY
jgi:gamma-glutamyltranspeptidase